MKARIEFTAQAWLNDYAISVDPQGDTVWLDDVPPGLEDDSYESDELRFSDAAPEWVKDWSGPFYIEVEYIDETAPA